MSAILDQDVAAFEAHRPALIGLAYRMLGSRAEAEDIVQDAYLRWHATDRAAIEEPRRYLGTIVTRLCLDRMKSAQARREIYVGQWLPEPVVDENFDDGSAGDMAHDISVALMLLLERLSPLERASFLLHDVFGLDFAEVARALGRGEAACRQLAARARAHIEAGPPRRRQIRMRWSSYWPKMRCSTPTAAASAPRRSIRSAAPIRSCASSKASRARIPASPALRRATPSSTAWPAWCCTRTTARSTPWRSSTATAASSRSMSCVIPISCSTCAPDPRFSPHTGRPLVAPAIAMD